MKKTLTENITRYDDKMRFRMDWKTGRAVIISLVPAALVGWLLCKISIMIGLPIALAVFSGLMLFQIGTVDGMTLSAYIRVILRQLGRKRLYYLYTETNRLSIIDTEKGSESHAKKQKQKKK